MYDGWLVVETLDGQEPKLKRCDFPGHNKCEKCNIYHSGRIYEALPVYSSFSDLGYVSRSRQT